MWFMLPQVYSSMSNKAATSLMTSGVFKDRLLHTVPWILKCWCKPASKWDQVQHGEHLAPFLLLSTALITQHNGDEICL